MQARADEKALGLLGIQLGAYALLSALVALALRSLVVRPLVKLAEVARRAQAGDRTARANLTSTDEIGVVSEAFDAMAAEVERTVGTLEETVAARTRALAEEVRARTEALEALSVAHAEKSQANDELRAAKVALEKALGEKSAAHDELRDAKIDLEAALEDSLRAHETVELAHQNLERTHIELVSAMAERIRLAETIQELSTPVMRIHRGILTMPLVGRIDAARAQQIEAKLLAGIERHDADEVLVDLSGVPYVDVEVARALVRAKRCGELVGARVSLVGLRGDVAKSVVHSGLDLSGLTTLADLESGLLRALQRRGLTIRPRQTTRGSRVER
jgi:anti-anti-sigma factor